MSDRANACADGEDSSDDAIPILLSQQNHQLSEGGHGYDMIPGLEEMDLVLDGFSNGNFPGRHCGRASSI